MTAFRKDPLWTRLQEFDLDQAGDELTFSRRLARENGWSTAFTRRAIEEYKRFCYLAVRAGHPVTPSEEVDQVWHLHLVYTRSYWGAFCGKVLEMPLHHGPTRGGVKEGVKYRDDYAATLASYRRIFGRQPPADLWPAPAARFRHAAAFRRVNTAAHWVVPKPRSARVLSWGLPPLFLSVALAASAEANEGTAGPLGWLAETFGFLLLIPAVILAVVIGLFVIPDIKPGNRRAGGGSGGGCSGGGWFDGGSGCGSGGCGGGCGS
jgi:uncharacterized membrane protein YgcG